ncbi:MAG: hypothetical protein WD529_06860 [Balneolaceae bacterium]
MSSPKRLQVKLFFDESTDVPVKSYIPVFHKWIQGQSTDDLLIDVHNYSHMHHGPGILLVAHESDFSIDLAEGKHGFVYRRKREFTGTTGELVELVLQRAIKGALLLASEKSLPGKVSFRLDEMEVRFMDRLAWPNSESGWKAAESELNKTTGKLFGKDNVELQRVENDSREPLTVKILYAVPLTLEDFALKIGLKLEEEQV